jgi:hypothetical protein
MKLGNSYVRTRGEIFGILSFGVSQVRLPHETLGIKKMKEKVKCSK